MSVGADSLVPCTCPDGGHNGLCRIHLHGVPPGTEYPVPLPSSVSPYPVKISNGRKADTTKLGTSTTSLTFRSTATLQMQ